MILTENELKKSYGVPDAPNTNPELETPAFTEALGAAFRQDNVVGSVFANKPFAEPFSKQDYDLDFDVQGKVEERGLDDYLYKFTDVFNEGEFERTAQKIENEREDRQTLQESGWKGITAQVIAGTVDPINLIPIGGAAVKGIKAKGMLQASINTAKVAAPSIVLQESLLNATQETRTLGESAVNVTAGTFLSGALGGAVHSISGVLGKKTFADLEKSLSNDLVRTSDPLVNPEKDLYVRYDAGAAAAFETTLKQESMAKSFGIGEATSGLTPVLRLARSPVKGVREFSQKLIDQPMFFNKNFEGIETPQSVENLRFEQDVRSGAIRTGMIDMYKEYGKNARAAGNKPLKKRQFSEAVSYAMRNGDVGASDEITKYAQRMRKEVIDPLKNRAIDAGLLPEDVSVSTADSYFTRLFSKERILADERGFKALAKEDLTQKIGGLRRAKAAEFTDKISKAKTKKAKDLLEVEKRQALEIFEDIEELDAYLDDITKSIFNNITGSERIPFAHELTIAEHGPLKGRTWDILDNKVQDYLENDSEVVLEFYNRSMTGQLLLQEEFGTVNFDKASKDLGAQFDEYKATIPAKDLPKANKEFKRNMADLAMLWDLTNGTYRSAKDFDNAFIRGLSNVRTLNYMRLLGGVTISSLADTGSLVMTHGFRNVFGDLLLPTIRNMKRLKIARDELRSAGLVWEGVLNSRVQSLAEIGDPTARGSYFSRMTNNMSTVFTQATLITQWNDAMKMSAGILTQSNVIKASKALASGKKLSAKQASEMKWMGLTDADLLKIQKMQAKHGTTEKGVALSGVSKWEDQVTARAYRAALNKSANSTIVTKGLGDVPAFSNSELGKSFMQFQSFSFAANQRITIRGAQRLAKGDAAVLSGITSMVTMGMLIAYLKAESYKEGITDTWSEDKWIMEGVDRSGLMPVIMMFNNPWERLGMPGMGAAAAAVTGNEAKPISRYAARGTAESLLGPTFGTVADSAAAVHSMSAAALSEDGELSKSDIHRMRKLLPFQNLTPLRGIFDSIEEKVVGE